MTTPKNLKIWLKENGFLYAIEYEEHPGCWDHKCSHLETAINIKHKSNKKETYSFKDCTGEYIIEILSQRLSSLK